MLYQLIIAEKMEFLAGSRLVDSPKRTLGAEAFDNYLKTCWQPTPAPANFSDGGDPADPFLSRQDTGCSLTTADSAIQSPKNSAKIKDTLQGVNLKSTELLFCPTKELTRQSKTVVKSNVVQPKRKPKTKTSGITYEVLSRLFDKPRVVAAEELNICKSTFRNICRKLGVNTWPYKKRSRLCCKADKYVKVIFEETEVSELTSLSSLDDKVMEESSNLTSEDESAAVILDDQFFLAELDATKMEDLGDIINIDEYGIEAMDDRSHQDFWEGLGNSPELDQDYLFGCLR